METSLECNFIFKMLTKFVLKFNLIHFDNAKIKLLITFTCYAGHHINIYRHYIREEIKGSIFFLLQFLIPRHNFTNIQIKNFNILPQENYVSFSIYFLVHIINLIKSVTIWMLMVYYLIYKYTKCCCLYVSF